MYHLLDLQHCRNDLRVGTNTSWAILDTEDISFAAVTRKGIIIYCNRAFFEKYSIDPISVKYPSIQNVLPSYSDHRDGTFGAIKGGNLKVINLWTDTSDKPIGQLLV